VFIGAGANLLRTKVRQLPSLVALSAMVNSGAQVRGPFRDSNIMLYEAALRCVILSAFICGWPVSSLCAFCAFRFRQATARQIFVAIPSYHDSADIHINRD
jgi:hypothetical protein